MIYYLAISPRKITSIVFLLLVMLITLLLSGIDTLEHL